MTLTITIAIGISGASISLKILMWQAISPLLALRTFVMLLKAMIRANRCYNLKALPSVFYTSSPPESVPVPVM